MMLVAWLNDETSDLDLSLHLNNQLVMLNNSIEKLSDQEVVDLAADLDASDHGIFDSTIFELTREIGLFWNRIQWVYRNRPNSRGHARFATLQGEAEKSSVKSRLGPRVTFNTASMDQGGPRAGPSGLQGANGDCSDEEDGNLDLYRQVRTGRVQKGSKKGPKGGDKNGKGGKGGKGGGKGDKGGKFHKRRH